MCLAQGAGVAPAVTPRATPPGTAAPSTVFSSRVRCAGAARVRVAVTYRGVAVYRGTLALCATSPAALPDQAARPSRFLFLGRPQDFAPAQPDAQRSIEGRVWEAAATEDGISLGLSFSIPGQVLLHTTHAAPATTRATNTLAAELSIVTEPAQAR